MGTRRRGGIAGNVFFFHLLLLKDAVVPFPRPTQGEITEACSVDENTATAKILLQLKYCYS